MKTQDVRQIITVHDERDAARHAKGKITIIDDDQAAIVQAFRDAIAHGARTVITTGGLGPTPDDLTVAALADADLAHLSGDARRVYSLLLAEWITYLGHLREDYPYLYSLALRTNPFDPSASVEVR